MVSVGLVTKGPNAVWEKVLCESINDSEEFSSTKEFATNTKCLEICRRGKVE